MSSVDCLLFKVHFIQGHSILVAIMPRTVAGRAVTGQAVANIAGAGIRTFSVDTVLLTGVSTLQALVDICKKIGIHQQLFIHACTTS